jgi:hypothetical protein
MPMALPSQLHSILELNGQAAFTLSEIKVNAVHAGPSDQLKLSQTDSVLPQRDQSMSFFHQKTWYLAIRQTTVAKVVTSTWHGHTSKRLVLFPKNASHTKLQVALPQVALLNAQTEKPSRNTNANQDQLFTQQPLLVSRLKSQPTVQLKVLSQYTLTS